MHKKKLISFIYLNILLVCIVLLAGCAAVRPRVESVTPPDISSILATLKMRYDLVDSMTTWMNVGFESHGQKQEIRESLYYEKPDKLRVDARGLYNEPRAVVLAVGKSLRIYFVAENEMIMGELSDGVIKEIFDVDLRVSDVRSSIFANPFLDGNVDALELESYDDEYLIRRASTRAGHREEILILSRDVVVDKWRIMNTKGEIVQETTFSKYREVGGILRPLKVVIKRPADETHISIESVNPEINVELAEMIFSLPIPEGAKIYQLSDPKDQQVPESNSDLNH